MITEVYNPTRVACLRDGLQLEDSVIKAYLIDTDDYTFSLSHASLASVPLAARVSEVEVEGIVVTPDGKVLSDTLLFTSVNGDRFESLILYNETLDLLLCHCMAEAPIDPDGGNVEVACPADGWLSLTSIA